MDTFEAPRRPGRWLALLTTTLLVAGCASTPSPSASTLAVASASAAPSTQATVPPASVAPTSVAQPTPTPAPAPTPEPRIVIVVEGDTLSGIAAYYGVTLADLLAANPQIVDASLIRPGDRIEVPASLANQRVQGTHDGQSMFVATTHDECAAYGWASDPDDRFARVTVRVLVDGVVRLAVVANEFRDGLAAAIGGDGNASFTIDLSPLVTPNVSHQIRVQAQDLQSGEWIDINSTPRDLTCLVTDVAA